MAAGAKVVCPVCSIEVSIFGYKTHMRTHVAKGEATEINGVFVKVGEGIVAAVVVEKKNKVKVDKMPIIPEFSEDGAPREFDFVAGRYFYNITNYFNQDDMDIFINPKARVVSPYLGVSEEHLSRYSMEKYLKRFLASILNGNCFQFQRIKNGSHYKIIFDGGQYYEIVTFAQGNKESIKMRQDAKQELKRSLSRGKIQEDDEVLIDSSEE